MNIEAQFIEPVGPGIKVAEARGGLPACELPGAGRAEEVVIALEPGLTVTGDIEIEAALDPEDVIAEFDVGGAGLDADGFADFLVEVLLLTELLAFSSSSPWLVLA